MAPLDQYTRFTSQAAIEAVKKSGPGLSPSYTVLDAAAKLASDTARSTSGTSVFYIQKPDGTKLVFPVTAFGGAGPA